MRLVQDGCERALGQLCLLTPRAEQLAESAVSQGVLRPCTHCGGRLHCRLLAPALGARAGGEVMGCCHVLLGVWLNRLQSALCEVRPARRVSRQARLKHEVTLATTMARAEHPRPLCD